MGQTNLTKQSGSLPASCPPASAAPASSAPARSKPVEYFGALDGFRGLLALAVAIYHTAWLSNINGQLDNAQVLVDLFFVFSGFLMFILYNGRLKTRDQSIMFIRRRIARIYPLHFFMLMMFVLFHFARVLAHAVGLSAVSPGEVLPFQSGALESMGSFFANLTLTQSMGVLEGLSFNAPSWTVSVEFYSYFVFLAVMLLCPPKKTWHFVFMGLCIAALYAFMSTLKPNMDFHYDYGFLRCLGGFFSGIIAAKLYGLMKPETRNGDVTAWATLLEIVTLIVLLVFVFTWEGKLQFFLAPVAVLFVFTFAIGRGAISTVMATAPMLYLGKISYSIYLVHMLIAVIFSAIPFKLLPKLIGEDLATNWFVGDLLLIPYLLIVVAVSHFTYIYVERAGQKAILAYEMPRIFKRKREAA